MLDPSSDLFSSCPLNSDQSKVVQFCCKEGLLDLGGATGIVGGTGDAEAGLGSAVPDGLGVVERTADRGSRSAKGSVNMSSDHE